MLTRDQMINRLVEHARQRFGDRCDLPAIRKGLENFDQAVLEAHYEDVMKEDPRQVTEVPTGYFDTIAAH